MVCVIRKEISVRHCIFIGEFCDFFSSFPIIHILIPFTLSFCIKKKQRTNRLIAHWIFTVQPKNRSKVDRFAFIIISKENKNECILFNFDTLYDYDDDL